MWATARRKSGGALLLAADASHGAINVSAGDDSQQRASRIDAHTAVNLWNKTAVPINSTPDARTNVSQNATVNVAATSNVLAAGDIGLAADRGAIAVSAVGIGRISIAEAASAIAPRRSASTPPSISPAVRRRHRRFGTRQRRRYRSPGLLRQSATQVDVEILAPARSGRRSVVAAEPIRPSIVATTRASPPACSMQRWRIPTSRRSGRRR